MTRLKYEIIQRDLARKKKDTLKQLSEFTGEKTFNLRGWANGRGQIPEHQQKPIAEFFGISVQQLTAKFDIVISN